LAPHCWDHNKTSWVSNCNVIRCNGKKINKGIKRKDVGASGYPPPIWGGINPENVLHSEDPHRKGLVEVREGVRELGS